MNTGLILLAVAGGVIIATLIIAGVVFLRIRHAVKKMTGQAVRINDVKDAISEFHQEQADTPRSVSSMTRLVLPAIVRDFPDFDLNEMKGRAENVLYSYLRAISEKNASVLSEGNSELKNALRNHIEALKNENLTERFSRVRIHQTEIADYRKTSGRCIVTFQSSIEYFHTVKNADGKVIKGSENLVEQSKFNTDLIYIQDRDIAENDLDGTVAMNCPNCGAPLKGYGAKVCEYCGAQVIELNLKAWTFSSVKEIV